MEQQLPLARRSVGFGQVVAALWEHNKCGQAHVTARVSHIFGDKLAWAVAREVVGWEEHALFLSICIDASECTNVPDDPPNGSKNKVQVG